MAPRTHILTAQEALLREHPGWTLADVAGLSPRERRDWLALMIWRRKDG